MKQTFTEILISLLLVFAIVFVIATGRLAYKSLAEIVTTISVETKPNLKLHLIKNIMHQMDKAESSVRSYLIAENEDLLNPFYKTYSKVDQLLTDLRNEDLRNKKFQLQVDTLDFLIQEKLNLWRELLLLEENDTLQAKFTRIEAELSKPDTIISVQTEAPGLLKRVFGKKQADTVKIHHLPTINRERIIAELSEISEKDSEFEDIRKEKENVISLTTNEITRTIYHLIEKMEQDEANQVRLRIALANELAKESYLWIATFSASATLLSLIVIFLMVRYIKSSRKHQKALTESKEATENLARAKEKFVANITHELKTPLNAINGFTELMLKKKEVKYIDKELKIIQSSGQHLLRLINDVLDFSKLQAGRLQLSKSTFEIKVLVDNVFQLFQHEVVKKNIGFSIIPENDLPDFLYGDPVRLKQILINLIGNAIKFTNEGKVTMHVKSETIQDSDEIRLVFIIKDTGIGIDKDKLDEVFEEFSQENNSISQSFGGTGLGLSIVKRLVDIHEGTIEVKSNKNVGSEFIVSIPYKVCPETSLTDKTDKGKNIEKFAFTSRVLIADDVDFNRLLLLKMLEGHNFDLDTAEDGEKALQKLESTKYDLVLMDVRMPGLDGYSVTKAIRSNEENPNFTTPVIAISAVNSEMEISFIKDSGMNSYLVKPVQQDILIKEVYNMLESEVASKPPEKKVNGNELQSLQVEKLEKVAGGDQAFIKEMMDKFMQDTRSGIDQLEKSFAEQDYEAISDLAHKLSPPCRHVGAEKLQHYFKSLDRKGDVKLKNDQIEETIVSIRKEFEKIEKLT